MPSSLMAVLRFSVHSPNMNFISHEIKVNQCIQILQLCSSDALWSKLYMQYTTQPITHELLMLTDKKGWKEVFFMNKVQLQVELLSSCRNWLCVCLKICSHSFSLIKKSTCIFSLAQKNHNEAINRY